MNHWRLGFSWSVWLWVIAFCACASRPEQVGSASEATTLGSPVLRPLGITDTYNTQIAYESIPNVAGGGIHLGTFTFGDPDRQVGYAAFDGNLNVTSWAQSSVVWPQPANWGGNPPFRGYVDGAQVFAVPGIPGNIGNSGTLDRKSVV